MRDKWSMIDWATALDLYVATYAPGDGIRRYRVFQGTVSKNYHSGDGIFTALGRKELKLFLTGYSRAYYRGKEEAS